MWRRVPAGSCGRSRPGDRHLLHLQAAFAADPDAAFSTDDLCRSVYQREPEKRHRVAVLRPLRHEPRIASLTADRLGGPLVFYRLGNPVGYGLAKLKVKAPESTDADPHGARRGGRKGQPALVCCCLLIASCLAASAIISPEGSRVTGRTPKIALRWCPKTPFTNHNGKSMEPYPISSLR